MNWIEQLKQPSVATFIKEHLNDDLVRLAFSASKYPDIPVKLAIQQIQARKKAKTKLPVWEQTEGLIFPPSLSMEQCSSEITARYKASIVSGNSLVDLTGGFGVDVFYFSERFESVEYVERQAELVELVSHNMKILGAENVRAFQMEATEFLGGIHSEKDVIYLDPARRGDHNEKVVLLSDCEPDVSILLPVLLKKAHQVLIKTSPMLDISRALSELKNVSKVYILAVDNECKEVLYLIGQQEVGEPEMRCVNISKRGEVHEYSFTPSKELHAPVELSDPLTYLYEPNVAIMKAGAFKSIGADYGLFKLHAHSHLYTSDQLVKEFPGRVFELEKVCALNKKELLKALPGKKANITVRNFPVSVADIRKKTGLKEGGEYYLLATTNQEGKPVVLVTKRQNPL